MVSKYWAGAITPAIIKSTSVYSWGLAWLTRAQKAEKEGNELIVLEVPKNEVTSCVEPIEQSLEMFLRLDVG